MRTFAVVMRYGLCNALLLAFIATLVHGGWLIWAVIALAALTGGVVDEAAGDDGKRIAGPERAFVEANLYATLPLLMVMTYLLATVAPGPPGQERPGASALVGAVIGAGYFYALAGVTVAHELTHRVANPLALIWARVLLAFTLNPTFESYHASGIIGTSALTMILRRHGAASTCSPTSHAPWFANPCDGWRLEAERLRRSGLGVWSPAQSRARRDRLVDRHLGCLRHDRWCRRCRCFPGSGRVRAHSARSDELRAALWACPGRRRADRDASRLGFGRRVSNALFYNLPRHADHHRFAAKPLWGLEVSADSPKLPYGYHTMSMISLVPSWWHSVMDRQLADWDERLADASERSIVRARGWTIPPM